ncbi:hypothetical protein OG689_43920 [Kitasatospora sp. NBC_00240]|uniref:hypothetical protein n=1 Tax=Kitasatospora sp. NBC_00240 TaxID=2903567 RepID=UPI0022555AD6|nr:hypothetical protein [Kitasatospora sp. NBC_00240]MCX5207746.1 hypothetical protein [Kitasatospora sp. NBC_00240]MCX5215355.1 hypothetical protein [Kitasatospora sp. NBC_00240]MCX5216084.1 hypothetical protein [Kitasatospora sp. NBC_00240]
MTARTEARADEHVAFTSPRLPAGFEAEGRHRPAPEFVEGSPVDLAPGACCPPGSPPRSR